MKNFLLTLLALAIIPGVFACTASFTHSSSPANNTLLNVLFTNTSNPGTLTTGQIATYTILFGDGGTASVGYGGHVNHNYSSPGTYPCRIILTVLDSLTHGISCSDTAVSGVTVSYPPCGTTFTTTVGSAGSVTCTATTPGGSSGMSYAWTFGDGNSGSGTPVTHTYATNGTYRVTLTATSGLPCSYTDSDNIAISTLVNCSSAHAAFTSSVVHNVATFTSTSSRPSGSGHSPVETDTWYFGDGSSVTSTNPSHSYATPGTYTVSMAAKWYDSTHPTVILCSDSIAHTVTTTAALNQITGDLRTDDSSTGNPHNPNFKVWLIHYNSATMMLSAVDSVTVSGTNYRGSYAFNNEPSDSYLVKAMVTNNTSSTGPVPTYYGSNCVNWSCAHTIQHTGGTLNNININLVEGTVTSGPGFIAGNVTSGANKSTKATTGTPAPNVLIFLENTSGQVLTYTFTDASGNYSFNNIAYGTYNVYPEVMSYVTVPTQVALSASNPADTSFNFKLHTLSHNVTGVTNVAAINTQLAVYPNPTSGIVNIAWENTTSQTAHAIVSDVVGHKVYESDLTINSNSGVTQINLSSLQTGLYFVTIKSADINYSYKIVLQK